MAGTTITVPSFDFSGFYYAEILEALILFKRINAPELSDESDFEPTIQLLRMFALVGHLNNVLVDVTANESTLPTAKLPETVRNMLRLIDYELSPATPSGTDLLYELSRVFTSSTEVIPATAQASTERQAGNVPVIFFEALTGLTIDRSDQFTAVFAEDPDGTFTDHTAAANGGSAFSVWGTVAAGAKIYWGHAQVMHNQLDQNVGTGADILIGAWEFYDGDAIDTIPDSVTNLGGGVLEFQVNGLLGTNNRAGAEVTVTLNSTTASETVASEWNGTENVVRTSLLAQSSPSTDVDDYSVGVEWQELDNVTDGTSNLGQTGSVTFDLPQTEIRQWRTVEVNNQEAFYIRFRIVEINSATNPSLAGADMTQGTQYVTAFGTQGRSAVNEVLGSSNGDADQRFETANEQFISGTETVTVDSVEWTRVDNFLNSLSQDQVYRVELGEDNRATIIFGDGSTGAIPSIGQGNVVISYRHNAEEDGNVGADTVTVDKTGLSFVSSITNPRQATGWAQAQDATVESLEQAKIAGPASLRTRDVAIGPSDIVTLVTDFVDENGSKPFGRAKVIEEGFGPKTIEVVVVARGGGQASNAQLTALDEYLNGVEGDSTKPKRIVANQEAVIVNFEPRAISVTAVVEAPSTVTAAQVVNQLNEILQPEALKDDGVSFLWEFGDEVPRNRIVHEIFRTDPAITDLNLTVPSSDTTLGARELPTIGTVSITIQASI